LCSTELHKLYSWIQKLFDHCIFLCICYKPTFVIIIHLIPFLLFIYVLINLFIAYIAVVRNHFFGNTSDKQKLYRETSAQLARSPVNFVTLRQTAANGGEKTAFCEHFCHLNNRFTHFPAADFREI